MNEDTTHPPHVPTEPGDAPPSPHAFVREFEKRHGPGRWRTVARELVVSSICCNVIESYRTGQGLTYRTVFDWKSVTDPVDIIVRAVADTHGLSDYDAVSVHDYLTRLQSEPPPAPAVPAL
ncbi:hypothetical protein DB345_00320 [Spartobacteria bacterium LR76]|nr:hypothetical protein DB345_00320 [Spartobacteria bacterium LR76]